MTIKRIQQALFSSLCTGCQTPLTHGEQVWCNACRIHLGETHFHLSRDHPAAQRFWGKIEVEHVTCFCYFTHDSLFRKAIHRFKYYHDPVLAREIGALYGKILLATGWNEGIDALVPVPMHWTKRLRRGYNQTEMIAKGIASTWNVPLATHLIYRPKASKTQTRVAFSDRKLSLNDLYHPRKGVTHSYDHLLLIDDVLTSGATLIACYDALTRIKPAKISILTLAFAE